MIRAIRASDQSRAIFGSVLDQALATLAQDDTSRLVEQKETIGFRKGLHNRPLLASSDSAFDQTDHHGLDGQQRRDVVLQCLPAAEQRVDAP